MGLGRRNTADQLQPRLEIIHDVQSAGSAKRPRSSQTSSSSNVDQLNQLLQLQQELNQSVTNSQLPGSTCLVFGINNLRLGNCTVRWASARDLGLSVQLLCNPHPNNGLQGNCKDQHSGYLPGPADSSQRMPAETILDRFQRSTANGLRKTLSPQVVFGSPYSDV
jgi:hypothetical protein